MTLSALGRIPEETISHAARTQLLTAFSQFHSHQG